MATLLGSLAMTGIGCSSAADRPASPAEPREIPLAAIPAEAATPGTAAPVDWSTEEAHPGSPLTMARLIGTARFGGRQVPATLEVGCRADDGGSTLAIGFRVAQTLAFDFDAFEGPEGIGQTHPLLQFDTADASPSRHRVGGWWADADTYVFGANQPLADALLADVSQWSAQPGRSLEFSVLTMERNTDPGRVLSLSFTLPTEGRVLANTIAPCLGDTNRAGTKKRMQERPR